MLFFFFSFSLVKSFFYKQNAFHFFTNLFFEILDGFFFLVFVQRSSSSKFCMDFSSFFSLQVSQDSQTKVFFNFSGFIGKHRKNCFHFRHDCKRGKM